MSKFKYPLVPIKGKAYWASVFKLNEMSKKYQIDIANLSQADQEKLKSYGVKIKNKGDDRGDFITCKATKIWKVLDANGNAWSPEKSIGNGSDIEVVVSLYDHMLSNVHGTGTGYIEVKVNNLVEYKPEPMSVAELADDVL